MLGDNLQKLRKEKGYSQETMAERLNVVRQTISKWEKGLSVPDAEMITKIADLFEVSVGDLLGEYSPKQDENSDTSIAEIAKQLANLNTQLTNQAIKRRKILKSIILIPLCIVVLLIVMAFIFSIGRGLKTGGSTYRADIFCTLDGESYSYEIVYYGNFQIKEAGGNTFISDRVQAEKYDDANALLAAIYDYFNDRGGTCEIVRSENR